MIRKIIILLIILVGILFAAGFSFKDFSFNKDNEELPVNSSKPNIVDKVAGKIQETVDKQVDNVVNSVESKLDSKLGEIKQNMNNVRDAANAYYSINNKMPPKDKLESFLSKKLSDMDIDYRVSNDEQRAFVMYNGIKYKSDKIPDIIINPEK